MSGPVAREEGLERLAMGKVQSPAAGHQEFPARCRHSVEQAHGKTASGKMFRGEQAGRTGADDRDVGRVWVHARGSGRASHVKQDSPASRR